MTVLNIYSLDDTEYQNIIVSLSEGKHIIGRGDLLKVTDKRVSRKHAVIEVLADRISLTSVHTNPCFFKAANGKTLSVISQNQQSDLHDGDQFALLPETCWFKVKIKREKDANDPLNGIITAEINGKRVHETIEENDNNLDSKRARLSTSDRSRIHKDDKCATTSNTTLELNENNEASHSNREINKIEEHNASLNLAETAREIKEEPREDEIVDAESNTSHNLPEDNALNTVNKETTSVQEVKEEPLDKSTVNNDTTPDQEVKREPLDNSSVDNAVQPGINDASNEQQPSVKTENEDNADDNPSIDGASGSGTGTNQVRRERCWYGDKCYRKNPNHRVSFAHPGDPDYDSDPEDDRPDCPFGASCYRKNIDHRREYKHVGMPAPKPRPRPVSPNSPSSPNSQNTPPNQKKPRRAATKKPKVKDIDSSQDDYDLDDPFINDGSSDDFAPSDDSNSDSDWEDSQEAEEESQERKRMLKEAKKFTKKGK